MPIKTKSHHLESLTLGLDEVGRGCWCGPVVVAAVALSDEQMDFFQSIPLKDSKKLNPTKRVQFRQAIIEKSFFSTTHAQSALLIDKCNILNATLLAMQKAILDTLKYLSQNYNDLKSVHIVVDGNQLPPLDLANINSSFKFKVSMEPLVGGDSFHNAIQAASIVAKVCRDEQVLHFANANPAFNDYDFVQNKGYGTLKHRKALERFGVIKNWHRLSFRPVKGLYQKHLINPTQAILDN